MAPLNLDELLARVLSGDARPADYLLAAADRNSATFQSGEGLHLDFKVSVDPHDEAAAAELARDILGFSNTEGGLIAFGVSDVGEVVGAPRLDSRVVHAVLGPYLGTRVDFEVGEATPVVRGYQRTLPYVLVRRALTSYPNLIRKDVIGSGPLRRKVKYLRGSLFYRVDAETRVEPTGGDIDARASELGFTGASPRTRSSFLLEEDRPGVRLYSHINDRFVGREQELGQILAKFEDARGRGVSIAGLGGIGKTELAIEVVRRLYRSGRFRTLYSASAKKTLLGAFGPQPTDPFFSDFPSFLRDLGAWLGIDLPTTASLLEMENACTSELARVKKCLLFVDNLETIDDGRLFSFLDDRVPSNVWLLTTSRIHKVKNYLYLKQLDFLNARDAAHLLRHELKRQGLEDLASTPIEQLEDLCRRLHQHPLTIRWYAWSCKKDRKLWASGPGKIPGDEIEAFCVGQTLQTITQTALKVLAAVAATEGQVDLGPDCVERVSAVSGAALEDALYELESAGLISSSVNDETGQVFYSMVPLATVPAREIARKYHWEEEFARGLRSFVAPVGRGPAPDPLIRDLLEFDPRTLQRMQPEEIADLKRRVEALAAECERHSHNIITADELYKEAADGIVALGVAKTNERYAKILLEAATVAKMRSQTPQQLQRAISYLNVIQTLPFASLRVLGTLVELCALAGDQKNYEEFLRRVTSLKSKETGRFSPSQINALDEALARAKTAMSHHRAKVGPKAAASRPPSGETK